MRDKKPLPDMGALAEAVRARTEQYETADKEASAAGNRRTTALNYLNEAQRDLDVAVKAYREVAPRETDWQREEREKTFVRVFSDGEKRIEASA